jgi:hypothetical protein
MGALCSRTMEDQLEETTNPVDGEDVATVTVASEHFQNFIQALFVDKDADAATGRMSSPNVKSFSGPDESEMPTEEFVAQMIEGAPEGMVSVNLAKRRAAITKTGHSSNQEDGHGDALVTCLVQRCAEDGSVLEQDNVACRIWMGEAGKEIVTVYKWGGRVEQPPAGMKKDIGWSQLNWVFMLDAVKKLDGSSEE